MKTFNFLIFVISILLPLLTYGNDEQLKKIEELSGKGDSNSQFELGTMYEKGDGVKQDDEKALELFQLSAKQSNAKAQFKLGTMYMVGLIVPQSDDSALNFITLSANNGLPGAQYLLGKMYYDGQGVKKDNEKAKYFYKLACENKIKESCDSYNLIK